MMGPDAPYEGAHAERVRDGLVVVIVPDAEHMVLGLEDAVLRAARSRDPLVARPGDMLPIDPFPGDGPPVAIIHGAFAMGDTIQNLAFVVVVVVEANGIENGLIEIGIH